jgi:multiple sugar transport system substrate-binding protein
MIRKTFLLGAAALAATVSLPGRAGPVPATVDKPVTITFYNYNLATAGLGADGTRKLLQEFMAANPNVKVNAVGVNVAQLMPRLQADVAAQRPLDVAQVAFGDLDFVAHNLGAQPIESIVPVSELAANNVGMAPKALKLGVLDGKTYAIRKNTGKAGFAAGLFGPSAYDWILQGVVRSNGGEVISRDRKTLRFAEPESVAAISMLRDLNDSGAMEKINSSAAMEAMTAGTLGMYLESSAVQGYLLAGAKDKFDLRATTMPAFGAKPPRPNNSGSALVILTRDPLKQRAAWELTKFLTSKRGYTVITSEIGYLPLRPEIVDDPQYLAAWAKEHPMVRPNLKQLAVLEPWDPMPGANYRQIGKMMMDAVEQAVRGQGDVRQTLKAAQDTAQALMPR